MDLGPIVGGGGDAEENAGCPYTDLVAIELGDDEPHSQLNSNPCTSKHPQIRTPFQKSAIELTNFDPSLSQIKRRELTLEWQKKRRDELIERIRNLHDTLSDSESEDVDFSETLKQIKSNQPKTDTEPNKLKPKALESYSSDYDPQNLPQNKKSVGTTHSKPKRSRHRDAPCRLMHSEWLSEKPLDFEDEWLAVVCPVGKRVIVLAARGKTRVFTRRNQYLGTFQSWLPGGRRVNYNLDGNRQRGVTVLDCIWSETSETFYVLDLISWNSHSFVNCDTEARQFFLQSKLLETPDLQSSSTKNPYKFTGLVMLGAEKLDSILTTGHSEFPEMIDGVLLYHKRAFYIFDVTPLVLWVLVPDISILLGITPSPELIDRCRPERQNVRYYIKKPELKGSQMDFNCEGADALLSPLG